jgi:tetratricopeptide (TPR) repeat protein
MIRASKRSFGARAGFAAMAVLFVVSAASQGVAQAPLPRADERWIEVRTANFRFFSNAGRGATRRIALDLEELRAVLGKLTTYELRSPVPTLIYLFKNQRSFTPFKHLYQGEPAPVSGYFLSRNDANYIALAADSRDASEIVFHEYVHYVSQNNLWWMPVWLSEGFAEFYQTFEVVGSAAYIGLPVSSHLVLLRNRTLIPFRELLAVDLASPLYNERNRKTAFYAQSWALTHYLMLGSPERRQQLGRYLGLLQTGTPEPAAFARAFEAEYSDLEAEVRAHLRGPQLPFVRAETAVAIDTAFEVREMSRAEVLYRLGDLLASQLPERPEALEFFEMAVGADPGHSPSLTALALVAERRADWDSAAAAHRRAVLAEPSDARALYHWGRFLLRRHLGSGQAVAVLRRATSADPFFAPAWLELSSAYAGAGDTSADALAAARTAHRMLPRDFQAAHYLIRLALRLDRRAEAARVIDTTFAADPRRAAEAWMAVLQNDLMRARDLVTGDELEAARARLDLAEADLSRAARPEVLRDGIESERRALFEREAASTYNRAAQLYSEGATAAARELLVGALADLPREDAIAWSCRSLLELIDHPERFRSQPVLEASPTVAEIGRLNDFLAAGSFKAAVELLREVRGRTPESRRDWVDKKISELEATLDYNRYVDRYNRAVDLYNRRHYDAAAELLEELLPSLPEGFQADSVRSLLDDARSAERSR